MIKLVHFAPNQFESFFSVLFRLLLCFYIRDLVVEVLLKSDKSVSIHCSRASLENTLKLMKTLEAS